MITDVITLSLCRLLYAILIIMLILQIDSDDQGRDISRD